MVEIMAPGILYSLGIYLPLADGLTIASRQLFKKENVTITVYQYCLTLLRKKQHFLPRFLNYLFYGE